VLRAGVSPASYNTTANLEKSELRVKNSFLSQFDVVLCGIHVPNQAAYGLFSLVKGSS
jgi:hypothetical protein